MRNAKCCSIPRSYIRTYALKQAIVLLSRKRDKEGSYLKLARITSTRNTLCNAAEPPDILGSVKYCLEYYCPEMSTIASPPTTSNSR